MSNPMVRDHAQLRNQTLAASAIAALFFFAIYWPIISEPRIWAEEGTLYYQQASSNTAIRALLMDVNGNFQLAINVISTIAARLDIGYFAYLTTYSSLLFLIIVLCQVAYVGTIHGVNFVTVAAGLAAIVALPAGMEVLLSATNLQWVLGLSVALLALVDYDRLDGRLFALLVGYVLFCALSGVPGCIPGAIFLIRYFNDNSARTFAIVLAIAAASVVQIGYILTADSANRALGFDFDTLAFPLAIQSIFVPFIGVPAANGLADGIRDRHTMIGVGVALVAVLVVALLAVGLVRAGFKRAAVLLASIWLIVGVVQLFGALGTVEEKRALISALGAPRYTYASQVVVVVMVMLVSRVVVLRYVSVFLLALIVFANAPLLGVEIRARAQAWPSWSAALATCEARPCEVPIWPGGWSMTLQP